MQIRQSKLLGNLIAIAAFDAEKRDHSTMLLDRLFLFMLGQERCHAMRLLASHLKEWELEQIRTRVEREIAKNAPEATPVDREDFYRELIAGLVATARAWNGIESISEGDSDTASDTLSGAEIRPNTGHLLLYVLASKRSIAGRILGMYHITVEEISRELAEMPAEEFYVSEIRIIRRREIGPEDDDWELPAEPTAPAPARTPRTKKESAQGQKKVSLLDRFGIDMTRAAVGGKIDPVVGRAREIERLVQILGRRKKNNPVLVGEAGVGKSAIVEGLALKIASGDVPAALVGKKLFSLDTASLVAGTKFRGEFEERLKGLVDELTASRDTIVFIDEVHTIVGAGSSNGTLDVANILKPALARGEMQCIGATTLDEYRENIEKDAALERRFQKIVVEPTSADETLEILRNVKGHYERHHGVVYTDEALRAAVELTERYVTDRRFPDKAIDALDEAGSKAALTVRAEATNDPIEIGLGEIEQVITTMTGIPVERVSQDDRQRLMGLESRLSEVVIGQSEAVGKVSRAILRSRSGLNDPTKPIGVFMFVGPTGVGKTMLAKELSKWMFDRSDALVRIDMSEFAEKHNVSRLIGSPPGYVGYGEGGQLTEAVRRQPYSVVLFDEIEKAHPDIFNVMLQMLDDGHLTDGLGRKIDFRNTIIIMTSNVGSRALSTRGPAVGYATSLSAARETVTRESEYRTALTQTFAPEFINRIDDIVLFNTLETSDIERVVDLELAVLEARVEALGYKLDVSQAARRELAALGYDPEYGVRSLKRTILDRIEEPLARMIVEGTVTPGDTIDIGYSGEAIELLVKTL